MSGIRNERPRNLRRTRTLRAWCRIPCCRRQVAVRDHDTENFRLTIPAVMQKPMEGPKEERRELREGLATARACRHVLELS